MEKKLISICITVYNLEQYIGQCLESILYQKCQEYEIILVDNGSNDNSVKICEAYANEYPNKIKFIALPKPTILGRSATVALENATGEYIQIIDGDDYVREGYLNDIVSIIKNKRPDVILGDFECIIEDGGRLVKDAILSVDKINNVSCEAAIKYILEQPGFQRTNWRIIFKREGNIVYTTRRYCYEKKIIGKYGDLATVTAHLLQANSIYYYDKPFYYYRCRRSGNLTEQISNSSTEDYFKSLIYLQVLISKIPMSQFKQAMIEESVKDTIEKLVDLFFAGSDLIIKADVLQDFIEVFKEEFEGLQKYNSTKVTLLVACIKEFGVALGIEEYNKQRLTQMVVKVQENLYQDIYIFPTGVCAEGLGRKLVGENINIKGYLDNSNQKQGKTINGIECVLPECLRDYRDKSQVVVIICTLYKELDRVLYKQLMNIGVENIIVDR